MLLILLCLEFGKTYNVSTKDVFRLHGIFMDVKECKRRWRTVRYNTKTKVFPKKPLEI